MRQASNSLTQRFENLIHYMQDAQANLAGSYRSVNVAQVEKEVEALLKVVKTQEPHTRQNIQPLIAQLITEMDGLAQALERYKENK